MADRLAAPCVLLEDRLRAAGPRGVLYAAPDEIVRCDDGGQIQDAFDRIEAGLARGLHAAGLFSYELGHVLEPRLRPRLPERWDAPLLWMGLFPPPTTVDGAALDELFAGLGPPEPIVGLEAGHSRAEHVAKVEEALRLIAAGDLYQVNLTFPFRFRFGGDPRRLYAAMRVRQPVAHGGLALLGDQAVLSASPELWIAAEDGVATARPMKGTAARGADAEADAAASAALAADPKQRAENLMIVDLLRNDLARVSEPGSVRVPELFTVETYPTFHTLTSTVVSRLRPDAGLRERVAALFPCGSIVGAPKIRAAEVADQLEASPRGVYTGALGAIAPNGDMRFNVAIRTAVITAEGAGRYGVGGGIVADSEPGGEYDEALLKGRLLTDLAEDYGLIETFRWSAGQGFVRLDLHLDRLQRSARTLGFSFDREDAEARLARLGAGWAADDGDRRVRLQLSRGGGLEIVHPALAPSPPHLRVGLAERRVDPGDPFLRHKTTRRELYDQAFASAAAAGLDEAIFLNRRGEIAEASRNTVFVRMHGALVTPPLSCGGLPGVLRQQLLRTGEAREGVITLEDLQTRPLLLGNSLHGLREATLA